MLEPRLVSGLHKMEKNLKNIVIVGGGIVGISSALCLIRRGCKVTIIEKELNGESASYGNASWLSSLSITPVLMPGAIFNIPKMLFSKDGPLFLKFPEIIRIIPWLLKYLSYSSVDKVNYISDHLAPLLSNSFEEHKKLAEGTDALKWIANSPFLFIYKNRKDYIMEALTWNIRKKHGFKPIEIEKDELLALVPGLSEEYTFAIKIDNQGYISNSKKYLSDLIEGFKKLGGKIIEDEVVDILPDQKVIIVKGKKDEIFSDGVVIAAGIFSDKLSKKFGANVPLQSERGYHLELSETNIKLNYPLMNSSLKLAITPRPNGIRFAGLVEFGSLNSEPNNNAFNLLMRNAKSMFPGIIYQEKKEWSGHRPATIDSLPLIGQSTKNEKVYFAYGHHHIGLTAGPKTGELVSKCILRDNDQIDLSHYKPDRSK